ncbi:5-oxoprolinase subunit PxpB [Bacillus sp. MUM 13]|uniref:5-oxoprolinase subunit PxpB n=1 Tax=Bacillus sp. MUM 13 TaxID=1678001 RepID=UPI0008F5DBB1|nr:5-oxoprolinase subunit PxpB [Bacillus sp. MUM 13]OIK12670.1 kinase inhibitor [Bacillus sp. MUM 13]
MNEILKENINIMPLGDSALIIQLGSTINPELQQVVSSLTAHLESTPFPGFIECVPAFASITVYYNPVAVIKSRGSSQRESPYKIVHSYISNIIHENRNAEKFTRRRVDIPVVYGGEYGPDLEFVSSHHSLSVQEVVSIHSSNDYLVYMIGFAPGFPYLGGMSEEIAVPRKSSPRLRIPAGSVGIAGQQTGVYPISTPGGWQIIGRTPLPLFNPAKSHPSYLHAGDIVTFTPIDEQEFLELKEALH